jgi:hypothetical protein
MISGAALFGSGPEGDVAAAMLIALFVAPCIGVWLLVRRVRRDVARLRAAPANAARRLVVAEPRLERAVARVRDRLTLPGPAREAGELRRDLQESVARTRASVDALPRGAGAGDLPLLLRRLERLAKPLEAELEHVRQDPDPALQATLLPGLRERVDQLLGVASRVRAGAALLRCGDSAEVAAELDADARRELEALQAGAAVVGTR